MAINSGDDWGTIRDQLNAIAEAAAYLTNGFTTVEIEGGAATIRSEGNLMLSADHDNNSGTSDSQIQFATNGVEIARFKSQGQLDLDQPVVLPVFATGSLPDATSFENGLIFVDDGGAKALAASDGTSWRWVSDGTVVS